MATQQKKSKILSDKEKITQEESQANKPIVLDSATISDDEMLSQKATKTNIEDCDLSAINDTTNISAEGNNLIDEDIEDDDEEDEIVCFAADNSNKLASILEKMDFLEKENNILKARNNEHEANQNKERTHIEETYEKEITDTRKLLDDMAQDKANMELDLARLDHDLKDVKNERDKNLNYFNKKQSELEKAVEIADSKDRENSKLKRELKDLQGAFSSITNENRKALDERKKAYADRDIYEADAKKVRNENKELKEKCNGNDVKIAKLKKEVDDTRTACQDEALKRVNCENQIATLTETLEFERKISKDKIADVRGNESFAQNVEKCVASRLHQALEEMRAEHEAELESTVNKLKFQYSGKLKASDGKIRELAEREREMQSQLKNLEITTANSERSRRIETSSLKKQIESLESDISTYKSDLEYEKIEKEKVKIDLQSRKAVWDESEIKYSTEIKNLKSNLEQKDLKEEKLRSELSKFGTLMNAAEERHKISSPDRSNIKQIRKAKRSRAMNKRRLSQMKADESNISSTSFTPQGKKQHYDGPTLQQVQNESSTPKQATPEKQQDCKIM